MPSNFLQDTWEDPGSLGTCFKGKTANPRGSLAPGTETETCVSWHRTRERTQHGPVENHCSFHYALLQNPMSSSRDEKDSPPPSPPLTFQVAHPLPSPLAALSLVPPSIRHQEDCPTHFPLSTSLKLWTENGHGHYCAEGVGSWEARHTHQT